MKSSLVSYQSGITTTLILFASGVLLGGDSNQTNWHLLFDGKTLAGWEILEDEGRFFVENGEIVGETTSGAKSSYLCTKESFDNFILEVEFKVDEGLNSGVQIRSDVYEEETMTLYLTGRRELVTRSYGAGRLFGYQIEIDTSDRAWTGGFYEQGRRGWLQTLEFNEPARKAFKQGQWNRFRIEVINDSFKTWLNGVPATDTRDAWSRSGRIGLQLHSSNEPGKQVRFRNIRIQSID
jgi:hypothetical protein